MRETKLRKLLTKLYKEEMRGLSLNKEKVFEACGIIQDMLRTYIKTTEDSVYMSQKEKKESIERMRKLVERLESPSLLAIDSVLNTLHNMDELSSTIGYSLPKKVRDWLDSQVERKLERG